VSLTLPVMVRIAVHTNLGKRDEGERFWYIISRSSSMLLICAAPGITSHCSVSNAWTYCWEFVIRLVQGRVELSHVRVFMVGFSRPHYTRGWRSMRVTFGEVETPPRIPRLSGTSLCSTIACLNSRTCRKAT